MKRTIGVSLMIMMMALTIHAAPVGIMVPAYFSPGAKWDAMNWAASRVPLIAIMNPNNGPGASQSSSYVNALASLHAAGGKVTGYLYSSYAARPLADVEADIDRYLAWYAVDGFFIDEMENDADTNHLNYYATLYQYIKAKGLQYSVTGNPGANAQESYITRPTADSLMIFESTNTAYASYTPSSWVFNYSPSHFVHLPYGASGTTTMSNDVSLAVSRNAGWVYISDLATYSALPTYWTNEVNLVQSLNGSNSLPVIMDPAQPADQSVDLGDSVTFQVTAFGPMPLTYQWFAVNLAGTNPIPSATNAIYTISAVQPADAGSYYLHVANTNGAVNSRLAALTIKPNTFKHITIDGAFGDWAGVPVVYTQAEDTSTTGVAFKDLYLANDDDYLYVRFTIYGSPTNVFTGFQNYFFNTDNNPVTGYAANGTGSELLIQAGVGYRETNGVFNAGAINGLNWQGLPDTGTQFEFRVSRHATNAGLNTPVFPGNDITLRLESDPPPAHSPAKWYPPAGSGIAYSFMTSPDVVITDPSQPADQYAVQNHPVTFNVVASGKPIVQYQWYHGVDAITNATNASYSIAAVSPTDAGSYHVTVSNPFSSTNSRTAMLTVLADVVPPAVTNITATARQIVITFSEPVDSVSAINLANYALSGGISITNATLVSNVVTLTTGSALSFGTVYSLAINGVTDLLGNAAHTTVFLTPAFLIGIDGNFSDWEGIAPIYSAPSGNDGAADFKSIYVYNDSNYYYFRATLWHDIPSSDGPGCFPRRANLFFDTDNNGDTGNKTQTAPAQPGFGSDFLQQSSSFYQQRSNTTTLAGDGQVLVNMATGYLIQPTTRPASYPADFEWRYPQDAMFSAASGGGLVFSTNVLKFFWQGQSPSFVPLNQAPTNTVTPDKWITYTNVVQTLIPPLLPGPLVISPAGGGKVALTWDTAGTLQLSSALGTESWTNLPFATSPYVIPSSGTQWFFRLAK